MPPKEEDDLPLVSRNLRLFREERGMSREELFAASGVSVYNIARYETTGRSIKTETLKKLADALGRKTDDFTMEAPPVAAEVPPRMDTKIQGKFDEDLVREANQHLARINRIQLERLRERKKKKQ